MRFFSFPSPITRAADRDNRADQPASVSRARVLWLSCMAHALHDGYTDMIYALLPVWQADFGLSYGALAILRGRVLFGDAVDTGEAHVLLLPAVHQVFVFASPQRDERFVDGGQVQI